MRETLRFVLKAIFDAVVREAIRRLSGRLLDGERDPDGPVLPWW